MSGHAKASLTDIAASVCAQMNFKHISYFSYIKKNSKVFRDNYLDNNILNKTILEQVCKDLVAVENEYVKGVLLEGFPNNLVNAFI